MSALTGGRWVNRGGIMRWVQGLPEAQLARPVNPLDLIACPTCRAKLAEPCRSAGGNRTHHRTRIIPRRCRCGNVLRPEHHFCTDECREDARRETYRRREIRTPTRERRKVA